MMTTMEEVVDISRGENIIQGVVTVTPCKRGKWEAITIRDIAKRSKGLPTTAPVI